MRDRLIKALIIATFSSAAAATDPLCCRMFGIDATPILGGNAVACGKIVDADSRPEAEVASREMRQRATRCALEAQSQRRAFVYTYRLLVSPDVDMVYQAVFGAHGERMLLKMGRYAAENIRTVERCTALTVLADGKLQSAGCYSTYPQIDSARPDPRPRG